MSHTPGPWRTDPEFGHEIVLGKDGVMVADCAILHKRRLGDTNKLNARLIAAAPAMLDALKWLDKSSSREAWLEAWLAARAAIAKAESTHELPGGK